MVVHRFFDSKGLADKKECRRYGFDKVVLSQMRVHLFLTLLAQELDGDFAIYSEGMLNDKQYLTDLNGITTLEKMMLETKLGSRLTGGDFEKLVYVNVPP